MSAAPSAQQLVFEGPDPERLLLEAWSVHGTQVRISEPVRVRRGGVGGFFAKLHYRIEVLPSPAPQAAAGRAHGAPGRERAAATVAAARREGSRPDPAEVTTEVPMVPAAPAAQQPAAQPPPPQQPPPGGPAASPLEALVAATEDEVDLSSSRRASFDDILDKVAGSLGDEPSSLGATLPAEPPRHAPEPPHHAPQPAAAPATPGRHLRSSALERPVVEARPWSAPGQRPPAPDGALTEQLELLGFPAGLIEQAATAPRTLLEAFALATSPRALPRTPGSLVAVVGSTQVAKRIAELCGVPAVELARARRWRADHEASSPLVVHDAYEAADLAPGWRRDRVAVVALAVSSAGRDGAWARQLLRALAPSMTIAVASATTKPEDVAATCEAIGGADALVLEDVDATLTPAASLSAGIPVGMLDGLPADAATWVAVASRALARRGARA